MTTHQFDEAADDYAYGRADDLMLHGIEPEPNAEWIEHCELHGPFEGSVWGRCPGCEQADDDDFEANKRHNRDDRPFIRTYPLQ